MKDFFRSFNNNLKIGNSVAYAVILLNSSYNVQKWLICANVRVVGIVSGLQAGFIKCICFLFSERALNYMRSELPLRNKSALGLHNIILVPKKKIILPLLHVKLGLIKQFIQKLCLKNPPFLYLKNKFPKLSPAKNEEKSVCRSPNFVTFERRQF